MNSISNLIRKVRFDSRPVQRAARLWPAIIALGLSGCAGDISDLQAYANEVKARPGRPLEPIPEIVPFESFRYHEHPADPFDPSRVASAEATGKGTSTVMLDTDRPREYLESFTLDSLKMVGTLEQGGKLWGLVQTPDGTIQKVGVGNYLGQNSGKITTLNDGEIVLREIIPDGFGNYVEREASIALSESL